MIREVTANKRGVVLLGDTPHQHSKPMTFLDGLLIGVVVGLFISLMLPDLR